MYYWKLDLVRATKELLALQKETSAELILIMSIIL